VLLAFLHLWSDDQEVEHQSNGQERDQGFHFVLTRRAAALR
jgi:hypothetical protein